MPGPFFGLVPGFSYARVSEVKSAHMARSLGGVFTCFYQMVGTGRSAFAMKRTASLFGSIKFFPPLQSSQAHDPSYQLNPFITLTLYHHQILEPSAFFCSTV